MVSVLPPTVDFVVRTVATPCWLATGGLLADGLVAAAAVTPPPMAAAAARLMLAMMIFGCRTVSSLVVDCALSTNTVSRRKWFTPRARGRPGEGADLVPGDGFLLQQSGGELVESLPVAGEQGPGAGFRLGQQGGDFLVDQPLGVLGVTAGGGEGGIAARRAAVADRADRLAEAELADHLGGQGGGGGQVVGGAGGGLAADQSFGGPAAEADGEGVGEVAFPVQAAGVGGGRLGQPEGPPRAQ